MNATATSVDPRRRGAAFRGGRALDQFTELLHEDVVFDGAELGRQIGLLPSRDSAADRAATTAFNVKTQLTDRWRERHARQRTHAP
ncbi:hypothetical protein ACFV7O_33960 [Streptomyces tendae]|uniref:hypothetical protein n=1 Tax=Streptomyces tendae TaxID=1932 RepID=UPI0036578C3D